MDQKIEPEGGMRICQTHWDAMRKAVEDRGMGHLGAKSGAELIAATVTELEGRSQENEYDPLMACHNMVTTRALEIVGLALLNPATGWNCPICMIMEMSRKACEQDFINGPADAALKECREKGLLS